MRKSRISGIDLLLQSTEKRVKKEEMVLVNFQLPVSLKKKMAKYCIDQDISFRDFLTSLIENELQNK
jgi:hypothetical protein